MHERLKRFIRESGIKQRDLAAASGIAECVLSDFIHERRRITFEMALALLTGCSQFQIPEGVEPLTLHNLMGIGTTIKIPDLPKPVRLKDAGRRQARPSAAARRKRLPRK